MKIAICCNHSYPHIGGAEEVIKQISESMVNRFNHEVTVISKSLTKDIKHNNVSYQRCPVKFVDFAILVNDYDHIFVYSDFFVHWADILKKSELIFPRKSIALVGMNYMMQKHALLGDFKRKKEQFKVITHSNIYRDYIRCIEIGVEVNVIYNGIDLKTFNKTVDFKEKYNIPIDKKIILCVSNFFPGKGQEKLARILRDLTSQRTDFHAVFVSSTVNFKYAQFVSSQVKKFLDSDNVPHTFLVDIPREDVISAYFDSDIFAFPSQIEAAPLVILESMAAKLPWIAMPVGNVGELKGGMLVPFRAKDKDGFCIYDDLSYSTFLRYLNELLDHDLRREQLGAAGYEDVLMNYNWLDICSKYDDIFTL